MKRPIKIHAKRKMKCKGTIDPIFTELCITSPLLEEISSEIEACPGNFDYIEDLDDIFD